MEVVEVELELTEIMDELWEIAQRKDIEEKGAGLQRAVAEMVLRRILDDRAAAMAYLQHHFPTNGRLQIAIASIEAGAHTR